MSAAKASAPRPRRTLTLRSLIVDEYSSDDSGAVGAAIAAATAFVRTVSGGWGGSFERVHALFARLLIRAGVRDGTVQCWEFPASRVRRDGGTAAAPSPASAAAVAALEELAWHRIQRRLAGTDALSEAATADEDNCNPESDVSEPCAADVDDDGEDEAAMPPAPSTPAPRPLPPRPTRAPPRPESGECCEGEYARRVTIGEKRLLAIISRDTRATTPPTTKAVVVAAATEQQQQSAISRMQWMRMRRAELTRNRTDSRAVHVVAGGSSLWLQIGANLEPSPRQQQQQPSSLTPPLPPSKSASQQRSSSSLSPPLLPSRLSTASPADLSVELGAAWDDEFTSRFLCHML